MNILKDDCSLISFNGGTYTRYESAYGDILWFTNYYSSGRVYSIFTGNESCELEQQYKASIATTRKITNWLRLK